MRRRENVFNPKRQIVGSEDWSTERRATLGREVAYGGNPEHKRRPGNYDLTPPSNPRPGKTLCDAGRDFLHAEALGLLREGFNRGLVSVQERNG
jgi:hypothetical protein